MEKKLALLVCSWLVVFLGFGEASESDKIQSYKFSRFLGDFGAVKAYSSEYTDTEDGSMQADKITALPGQPEGVDFDQYAGYVTVNATNGGKALFYYFVESPQNSSTNPLVLWLNGGPGCSSVGFGGMAELGPFRVNNDGKTLFRNNYAWNNVANVIFLESPAGVGFSYSNTSSDYDNTGDKSTADDAYTFLVNWLERFPQYKTRDFYIVGESYGGHYAPQLAYSILLNNENTTQTIINLKGVAIGNGWIDDPTNYRGMYDSLWTHGFISDETYEAIVKDCGDFSYGIAPPLCNSTISKALTDRGNVDNFNVYAPLCHDPPQKQNSTGSINAYDPCFKSYLLSYFNQEDVQKALHANPTNWSICRSAYLHTWNDRPTTILPIIKTLMASGLRLWMYSGDLDPVVPVTSARYTINSLKLQVKNAWSPWYSGKEVGGNVVAYEGLTFITIRAAGHLVPTYQPERSLIMVSSFLQGILPPSS